MTHPGGHQRLNTPATSESASRGIHETLTRLMGQHFTPLYNESSYGGLFSNLNTSTVKNLYFSSGGFSSKYGNALSGILDIETKNEPESINFLVGISMAAVNLNGEIPIIDDRLGIRFTTQQSFTKPIMWFNGSLDEFTTSPTSRDLSLSVIYRYSKSGRIKIFGLSAEDRQGVNVDRAEYDGIFNGNSKNNFINLRHTDILAANLLVKNSLSFNRHTNLWKLGILDFKQTDDVIKIRSDVEYQIFKNLKLVTGLEFEQRERNYLGTIPEEDYDIRPEAIGENIEQLKKLRTAG